MISELYLAAARNVATLLREPAVAENWDKPSALAKLTVGGLAAHLARQIRQVPAVLDQPVPDRDVLPVLEHYTRSRWVGADLDSEVNAGVRQRAGTDSSVGPDGLAAAVDADLAALHDRLPRLPADRPVHLPWGPWSLTLDDFLTTRLLEISIHSDDLAVSVGVPTPDLPPAAVDVVVGLLARLAVHRHGAIPVLRALGRAERAPASIAAI